MMRHWFLLAALLLPAAGHAASVTTPSGFTPAPVPNQDLFAPMHISRAGPTVSGTLNQPRILLRSGDGYTPGSNFSSDLERRSRASGSIVSGFAPTLSIKFPLN